MGIGREPKITYSERWFVYDDQSKQGVLGCDLYGRLFRQRRENFLVLDQPYNSETEYLGRCVLLHKESYRLVML